MAALALGPYQPTDFVLEVVSEERSALQRLSSTYRLLCSQHTLTGPNRSESIHLETKLAKAKRKATKPTGS